MDKRRVALEVLAEIADRPVDEITEQQDLAGDLRIDSPKALQLLVALEERLGIEIPDEAAARMDTVGDVLTYADSAG